MRLSSKPSKRFLPLALASAITAAITGCNGGGSDSSNSSSPAPTPVASQVEVPVDSVFAAMLRGRIDHTPSGASAAVTYYDAELVALNTETNAETRFEWPMVVDEAGMAASQKTVTLPPGVYNFTLSVTKGSEQYIGMLAEYIINDTDEVRLNLELEPVIGQTIVDIEAVMQPSQLTLEYPPEELVAIDDPIIGITIDGEEHLFSINKTTGIADILLSIPEGSHTYEVKLYNGNILIGRSEIGEQTLDLAAQGDSFDVDIISLQADVTVETNEFNEPFFTFNIPADVIDHIGDVNMVNLNVRLVDASGVEQEEQLVITEENGSYRARHLFNNELTAPVVAYLQFLDLTSGTPTEFASCNDTITIGAQTGNTVSCDVGMPIAALTIGGNLLATVAVNVLDQNGEAQSGAEVFIDGVSAGITGSNFGTIGFLKKHVVAGDVQVSASKGGLSDSENVSTSALGINNVTLVLEAAPQADGSSCKAIKDADPSAVSQVYKLDVDGAGGIEAFDTWCDMDTDGGGWTLVQNRRTNVVPVTLFNLPGPVVESGQSVRNIDPAYMGAISNDAWNYLRARATNLGVYTAMGDSNPPVYLSTSINKMQALPDCDNSSSWAEAVDLLAYSLVKVERDGCDYQGGDYAYIGYPSVQRNADMAIMGDGSSFLWEQAPGGGSHEATGTAIYLR